MTISEALLPEFDQEMAYSRKTLERVPDDRLGWKPHEKSMTMGRLASHLSEAPGWTLPTLEKDALDMAPPGTPPYQPVILSSRKEMLEKFDKEVVSARAAIAAASDQHLFKPWSFTDGRRDTPYTASNHYLADLGNEPQYPPSRPARRLSAPQ